MTVTKDQVLDKLRRVKGPDLEGNIVDLGLVSEILIKDGRVYFSITVPADGRRSWSRCARRPRRSSRRSRRCRRHCRTDGGSRPRSTARQPGSRRQRARAPTRDEARAARGRPAHPGRTEAERRARSTGPACRG